LDTFPWPSIAELWFLSFNILQHPRFRYLLAHLRSTSTFNPPVLLDLGTTLGQDLRFLSHSGAPSSILYGSDYFPEFQALGTELFRDADQFMPDHFIAADILSEDTNSALLHTRGSWSVIHSNMFLHRFDLATQETVARTMLTLVRSEPGCFIIGLTMGTDSYESQANGHSSNTLHTRETLRQMWERAGRIMGIQLNIEVQYGEYAPQNRSEDPNTDLNLLYRQRVIFFFVELAHRTSRPEWRVFG
jgi:hypothetical protein